MHKFQHAIAAWRAGQAPHLVQMFEVGTGSMLAAGPAVKQAWELAKETGIEIDYQLSQAGRGLKYSSDPTLWIKEPAGLEGEVVRGAATAPDVLATALEVAKRMG